MGDEIGSAPGSSAKLNPAHPFPSVKYIGMCISELNGNKFSLSRMRQLIISIYHGGSFRFEMISGDATLDWPYRWHIFVQRKNGKSGMHFSSNSDTLSESSLEMRKFSIGHFIYWSKSWLQKACLIELQNEVFFKCKY